MKHVMKQIFKGTSVNRTSMMMVLVVMLLRNLLELMMVLMLMLMLYASRLHCA